MRLYSDQITKLKKYIKDVMTLSGLHYTTSYMKVVFSIQIKIYETESFCKRDKTELFTKSLTL